VLAPVLGAAFAGAVRRRDSRANVRAGQPKVPVGHEIRSVAVRRRRNIVERTSRRAACCQKHDDMIAAPGSSERSRSRAG
jgi:hypothetical protein